MQWHVAGVFENMTRASGKFTDESNSEKLVKIGQHLSELWMRIKWHVFMAHSVRALLIWLNKDICRL